MLNSKQRLLKALKKYLKKSTGNESKATSISQAISEVADTLPEGGNHLYQHNVFLGLYSDEDATGIAVTGYVRVTFINTHPSYNDLKDVLDYLLTPTMCSVSIYYNGRSSVHGATAIEMNIWDGNYACTIHEDDDSTTMFDSTLLKLDDCYMSDFTTQLY